jgi:hypothetical protein
MQNNRYPSRTSPLAGFQTGFDTVKALVTEVLAYRALAV